MMSLSSDQITSALEQIPGCVRDEPMAKHTNFRIGGPARLYVVAYGADPLLHAVDVASKLGIPWYVFGGGSNLLVADEGYEGLVIQSALRMLSVEGNMISCESGVITGLAARKAADAGLLGFEWAIGVPGTIGGAVYGNAGCYGGEMKDVVQAVDAYRVTDGQRVTYTNAECGFGYRESRFKTDRHIILGCTIALKPGEASVAKQRMQEIVEIRKAKQPLELSSAGCAFKNFEFTDEQLVAPLQEKESVPPAMILSKTISAGWLVDRSGSRGLSVGKIAVSDKHGNFLVNLGGGTAHDVRALIAAVKTRIHQTYGIELHEEVQLLGFND
jgi:UDP-N-acetylmuramate dehydrogenase